MRLIKIALPVSLFLLAFACAKQTAPTGGPSDTIPPRLTRVIPPQGTTNYSGNKVEMEFSEFVDLNNPKEQIIITPSIGKEFNVTVNRRTVTIELEQTLEANTTYSINLREAVRDVTEKNPATQYQYAFSTGSTLDSLTIRGSVSDLLSSKPLKEITVSVHPKNDTFNILKNKATYFTKTDKDGNFTIDFLKPGEYFLYAFDDKNRNLVVDSRTELYGFKQDLLPLNKDTSKITLPLVKLDARPLRINSSRPYNTYFTIRASKSFSDIQVTATDQSDQIYYSYGDDQSNIKVFNTLVNKDSTQIKLSGRDSIGNQLDTTLYIKFQKRDITPERFESSITSSTLNPTRGTSLTKITFSKPIALVTFDSVFIRIDSATKIPIRKEELTFDSQKRQALITKSIDPKLFNTATPEVQRDRTQPRQPAPRPVAPEIFLGKGAFISVENDSTKRTTQAPSIIKDENLSTILFAVDTAAPNFIVQLLDSNLKLVTEVYNQKKGEFKNLVAGDYYLRVISDRNNNRKWDPGNYLKRIEPEPISYSTNQGSTKISLKASWDLDVPKVLINP